MSKIIIPFSGGVNSVYAAYRWLTETSHDIVCIYGRDDHFTQTEASIFEAQQKKEMEEQSADKTAAWLKNNVRDFIYEKIDWPLDYSSNLQTIRAGFSHTINVGIIKTHYQGYVPMLDSHSDAAGIVIGVSLENTSTDNHLRFRNLVERDGVDIYLAGVRELNPVAKGSDFNYTEVAKNMSGRFEQMDFMPKDLLNLVKKHCPVIHDPRVIDVGFHCMSCLYYLAYTELDYTGKELDDMFAKHGSYGAWRNEADPKTYVYRNAPQYKVIELLGLEEAFHMVPPPIPE